VKAPPLGAVIGFAGLFGLLIGSFLNVVVYRLPRAESVSHPPSHCPRCDARLTALENVPLVSWIALRGRCRHCGEPISPRYPMVEALTGVVFAASAWAVGPSAVLAPLLLLGAATIAAGAIDLDGFRVPWAVAGALAVGAAGLGVAGAVSGADGRLGWALLSGAAATVLWRLSWAGPPTGALAVGALAWSAGWWAWGAGLAVTLLVPAGAGYRALRRQHGGVTAAGTTAPAAVPGPRYPLWAVLLGGFTAVLAAAAWR